MQRRNATIAAAVVLAAIALAACGSTTTVVTDHSAATTGTGAGTSTAPQTATSTQASTTTSTGVTTTSANTTKGTVSSTPACVASMLKLAYLGGQGATGHGELGFSLTNTSGQTCHTYGYPGVEFQTSSGAPLPTNTTRTTQDFFGSVPLRELLVTPGESVSFRLGVTHGEATSAGCVTAALLQAIPPDDTHTLVVAIPNGGAYECGTATVSPLQPGDTAYR